MLQPALEGGKVEVVGDDAWPRVDPRTGELRAINPGFGFFGVAPGTSEAANPQDQVRAIQRVGLTTQTHASLSAWRPAPLWILASTTRPACLSHSLWEPSALGLRGRCALRQGRRRRRSQAASGMTALPCFPM